MWFVCCSRKVAGCRTAVQKTRAVVSCGVCGARRTRGIHGGIQGGFWGDPGPKRGIRAQNVLAKPMKTRGSTATRLPLYNIKRGNTWGRGRFFRCGFLKFYPPSVLYMFFWAALGPRLSVLVRQFPQKGFKKGFRKSITGTRTCLSQTGPGFR